MYHCEVNMSPKDVEAFPKMEKPDRNNSIKAIVRIINLNIFKKTLSHRKILNTFDIEKYNFNSSTKNITNKKMTLMDGITVESSKPQKVFHTKKLWEIFLVFIFDSNDKGLFQKVSQNAETNQKLCLWITFINSFWAKVPLKLHLIC